MFAGTAVYRQHRQRSSTSSYRVDSSFFIGKRQLNVNVNEDRQRSLLHNNLSLPPEQQVYRNDRDHLPLRYDDLSD